MRIKSGVRLKDLIIPGLLALMWAFFLLWYGATF